MRKLLRISRTSAVSLACLAWLLPVQPGLAAPPVSTAAMAAPAGIVDVRLDAHGAIHGHLLDAFGHGLADRPVVLQQVGGAALQTQTDAAGRFVLRRVGGGVHQLTTGHGTVTCRVWTHAAAPPSATNQLTVVADQQVVRGQQPFSAIFTNPLFIGLVIAAAIAIPIAVHNSQDDQPSGS
jgi:hypothetical protein